MRRPARPRHSRGERNELAKTRNCGSLERRKEPGRTIGPACQARPNPCKHKKQTTMSGGTVPFLNFDNSAFKPCDPTKPGPQDCIMVQQNGKPIPKKMLQQQSWPPTVSNAAGSLAQWHSPAFGYFNSTQQTICGDNARVGVDNVCFVAGPVTPASLSPPWSRNPGPYNMDNGRYLYELTQPVPPLTGMSTSQIIVQDKTIGTSGM